jgi:hypothetical protein
VDGLLLLTSITIVVPASIANLRKLYEPQSFGVILNEEASDINQLIIPRNLLKVLICNGMLNMMTPIDFIGLQRRDCNI